MNIEPAVLARARRALGVHETPGPVSTPQVLHYRQLAGLGGIRGDDSDVPWCAIFVNAMLREVHLKGSSSAMARSFSRWGNPGPIGTPRGGDGDLVQPRAHQRTRVPRHRPTDTYAHRGAGRQPVGRGDARLVAARADRRVPLAG